MGFFKTAKDVKNLTSHHGGMPSIRGSFKDLASMADDRGEGEVIKKGVPAKAIVKGFAEPVPGDKFAMHIPLEIHPPGGGAPYTIDYVFPTTRMKAAITVGMELPVKVLQEDPSRVAVQWDAQQASIAAAGGDMAAVMSGLNATYNGTADAAMRAAQANAAAEDPTAKLQKLTQMRDSGLITADEFDAKKKEILEAM
jgi:putative oligomerization/nucleic acid binding protein